MRGRGLLPGSGEQPVVAQGGPEIPASHHVVLTRSPETEADLGGVTQE